MKTALVTALLLSSACTIARPFEGPGFRDGKLTSKHEGDFIAVVGELTVKDDDDAQSLFDDRSNAIFDHLDEHEGLVGSSASLTVGSPVYKVLTVWETEDDMYQFVFGKEHTAAMESGPDMAESARIVKWSVKRADVPPTWDEANAKLDDDGKEIRF